MTKISLPSNQKTISGILLFMLCCGCEARREIPNDQSGKSSQGTVKNQDSEDSAMEFDIRGVVVAVNANRTGVTLNHQDIAGLMKGMTMEFELQNPTVISDIKVGDQVDGRLRVSDGKYTITKLSKR